MYHVPRLFVCVCDANLEHGSTPCSDWIYARTLIGLTHLKLLEEGRLCCIQSFHATDRRAEEANVRCVALLPGEPKKCRLLVPGHYFRCSEHAQGASDATEFTNFSMVGVLSSGVQLLVWVGPLQEAATMIVFAWCVDNLSQDLQKVSKSLAPHSRHTPPRVGRPNPGKLRRERGGQRKALRT